MPFPNALTLPMVEQMLKDLDLKLPRMRTATEISALMHEATAGQKTLVSKLERMMSDADFPFETKVHPDWRPQRPGDKRDTVHIGRLPSFSLRSSASKLSTKP